MERGKLGAFRKLLLWGAIIIFIVGWGIGPASAEKGRYTRSENGSRARMTGLTIAGPDTVAGNTATQYTATAIFSDGSTRDVTDQVSWRLRSRYASISSGGVLTTGSVTMDRTVTLYARYGSENNSMTTSKQVTITPAPTEVSLSGLSISGPASVASGGSASYTATAVFSDGTSRNVTTSSTWSEDSNYASISASGILTATAVTSDQSVTVSATYASGGVTRTATLAVTITASAAQATLTDLTISGPSAVLENSTANYTATAAFSDGTSQTVTGSATWSVNGTAATISTGGILSAGTVTSNQTVTVNASYTADGTTKTASLAVTITAAQSSAPVSITSTSQNRDTLPAAPVPEQPLVTKNGFNLFASNDLGMHCGDLDHRVVSILPPYNNFHVQVIEKGTSSTPPQILTSSDVDVVYSASSNPKDPALANPPAAPIYKTNFWDPNPATGDSLAFDGYDPFYPPNILNLFPLNGDMGLPSPDLNQLYPTSGGGTLAAFQQDMPGVSAPYTANDPQTIQRFDTDYPFFVNFPFGYRQTNIDWFAADGITMSPVDDFGRTNSFPLMRVQAKTADSSLTGTTGEVLASTDTVLPISSEASCYACHTSAADGGNGQAAGIPGIDPNAAIEGSPRSGTAFTVATAADDTSNARADVKREWAADTNILRLHDAKLGTHLADSTPVVCQTCHYSPALDLANVGPLGPGDADANGRDQRTHHSNSRALHEFHSQFTDLFLPMPAPTDPRRLDPATGRPTVNSFVQNTLDQSCYQCHPGKQTQCLRGAMKQTGLICQDCHGNMAQVGDDFSVNFSAAKPYPAGADLSRRVPWANMPKCQSCHTGDAMNNLDQTATNVVKSSDGIHLLEAYHTDDATATPILATNKRFAEETAPNGNTMLYRLSKGHGGVFCEACHGSPHAIWPVQPESGNYVANDNMAAIELQGHTGKIIECTACHAAGSLPVSLGGPHGMHPVGDQRWVSGHNSLVGSNRDQCRACHGQNGQGTVLAEVSETRTLNTDDRGTITLTKGEEVSCNLCHSNPL